MSETEFLGNIIQSTLDVRMGTDGQWVAKYIVKQERTYDLLHWEKKDVMFMSTHKNLDKAVADVTFTAMTYLQSVNGSLFEGEEENGRED